MVAAKPAQEAIDTLSVSPKPANIKPANIESTNIESADIEFANKSADLETETALEADVATSGDRPGTVIALASLKTNAAAADATAAPRQADGLVTVRPKPEKRKNYKERAKERAKEKYAKKSTEGGTTPDTTAKAKSKVQAKVKDKVDAKAAAKQPRPCPRRPGRPNRRPAQPLEFECCVPQFAPVGTRLRKAAATEDGGEVRLGYCGKSRDGRRSRFTSPRVRGEVGRHQAAG